MRQRFALPRAKVSLYLTEEFTVTCILADTWYDLPCVLADGDTQSFLYTPLPIVYTGPSQCVMFNGVSMLHANKTCRVNYGLFVNDVLQSGCNTPLDVEKQASMITMSCCKNIHLTPSSTIKVMCKTSVVDTILTVNVLNLTLIGECL